MFSFKKDDKVNVPKAKASEIIGNSVDSIMSMFTETLSKLDKEESKAVAALEQTEEQIKELQEEKTNLELVKSRISSMADKIRNILE